MPDIGVSTGFKAEYFDVDHTLRKLDDVDWSASPTHQDVTSEINYANSYGSFWQGGSTDTFGARISGHIDVEEGGAFDFFLGGDDGAVLFINGSPVIDNDGLHGFRTRTGEIELEPGTHHIEVRYFENSGRAGLKLEWEGPGLDGRELVTPPAQDALQTVSGTPLTVDLDVDQSILGGQDSLVLAGLPEGTIVSGGDISATVGEDGAADITGWPTDVLSITPPVDFSGAIVSEIVVTVHDTQGHAHEASEPLEFVVNEAFFEPPQVEMMGGFKASYFDMNQTLRKIDDIDWDSTPTHEEIVSDINYENSQESFWEGGSKDTFGAKLEGEITIESGGSYTFFAGGDDGVIVYIDGAPVINNDGLHGFRTRSGEIELEPGTYEIEVRYFENYGSAGLKLEWDGPDTDGRELVKPDAELHVEENGTFDVTLNVENAGADATLALEGLPADTIVHFGDTSLVTDGSPVDVTGFDVGMLEISPPPGFEGVIDGQIVVTDVAFNGSETQSSTPFTLTVGDVENQATRQEFDESLLDHPDAKTQNWMSEPELSEADLSEDDVLSEPMPMIQNEDSMAVSTETYERVDW